MKYHSNQNELIGDLINFLNAFIDSKVNYQDYIQPIILSKDLTDIITQSDRVNQLIINNRKIFRRIEEYIIFTLGHISSNPSLNINSFLINNCYCFSEDNPLILESNIFYPNLNEEECDKLFNTMLETLQKLKQNESNNYDELRVTPKVFLFEGDRGVGKTIFLNYFFNKYNESLLKNKILWVRLDFDSNSLNKTDDLSIVITNKLFIIILKYYIKSQKTLQTVLSKFELYLKNSVLKPALKKRVLEMIYCYIDSVSRDLPFEIKDTFESNIIRNILYDLLKDEGYKVIYIFDNIDLLDKSRDRINNFYNYLEQLKKSVFSNLKKNGIFVVTYRTNMKDTFSNIIAATAESKDIYYSKILKTSFNKIYNKKINVLKKHVPELLLNIETDDDFKLVEHVDNFESFIKTIIEVNDFSQFIEYLDKLFKDNNRSKTQIIHLLYHAFIYNDRPAKSLYKIVEILFLSGYNYTPKIFDYSTNESNELFLENANRVYDNIFVPNLFSYPYASEMENIKIPYSKTYLLIKIRILQFIFGYYFISKDESRNKIIFEDIEIDISMITSYLTTLYNYDDRIIRLCLDEFCELEFIELKTNDSILIEKNSKIKIKYKIFSYFAKILASDKRLDDVKDVLLGENLFCELAYYNLAATRMNISKRKIQNNDFLFLIGYNDIYKNYENFNLWVKMKIINSFTLLKFIKEVESFENENIETPIFFTDKFRKIYETKVNFSELIMKDIYFQLSKILMSVHVRQRNNLYSDIVKHFNKKYSKTCNFLKNTK